MSSNSGVEREAKSLVEKIRRQHSLEGHDELAIQVQELLHLIASELYNVSNDYDENELVEKLKTFDPALLVFLKKIQRVTVRVLIGPEQSYEENLQKMTTCENGNLLTILTTRNSQMQYLTIGYQVHDFPIEPRRPLPHYSIELAFPLTDLPKQPQPSSHNVYATLPINDYGLRFLVNADFLLTANRSHIDVSLPWNQTLRDGLAHAFVQAIDNFNGGSFKYYWPHFIPNSDVTSFFQPSSHSILRHLRQRNVVESSAGTLCTPGRLFYTKYVDDDGRPFTHNEKTENKYLSPSYPSWTIHPLLSLGVRELTDELFLEDLESMISASPASFHDKPSVWHAKLAKALLSLIDRHIDDISGWERILLLPIVPLLGGGWAAPNSHPVFFSKKFNATRFPVSTVFKVVDPEAAAQPHRRMLFERLSISEVDTPAMCRHIADTHASSSFRPNELSQEELISHAKFLFEASWLPPDGTEVDLWFTTSDGGRCKGSHLYIRGDFSKTSSATRVYDKLSEKFAVIHEDYIFTPDVELPGFRGDDLTRYAALQITQINPQRARPKNNGFSAWLLEDIGDKDIELRRELWTFDCNQIEGSSLDVYGVDDGSSFKATKTYHPHLRVIGDYFSQSSAQIGKTMKSYLVKTLHLSDIPRLVSFRGGYSKYVYHLSEEFKFLLQECTISDIIDLLHSHWKSYSPWIELDVSTTQNEEAVRSNASLIRDIGASIVQTVHGFSPLSKTVLPKLDSRIDELELPIPSLDISNSEDKTLRRRLACFGIKVENDVWYYIRCLESICQNQGSPEYETISYIYEQIQSRYDNHESAVDDAFNKCRLIYDTNSKSWLNATECAQRRTNIRNIYPTSKDLFLGIMGHGDRRVGALAIKARSIKQSSTLSDILGIFADINESLGDTSPSKARKLLKTIRSKAIFPIREKPNHNGFDKLLTRNDSWFIADRPDLAKSFDGKIPLLALHAQDISTLEHFLEAWQLNSLRLSKLATMKSELLGGFVVSHRETDFIRNRSVFLRVLVPKSNPHHDAIKYQLENVTVIRVKQISRAYAFQYKNEPEHIGSPVPGEFAISPKQEHELRIFTTQKRSISRLAPLKLVDLLAAHCGINDPIARCLLSIALSDPDIDRVQARFGVEGYHIKTICIYPTRFQRRNTNFITSYHSDRSVPVMQVVDLHMKQPEDPIRPLGVSFRGPQLDPCRHLEYLGEHMGSLFFTHVMGTAYNPLRHWTSDLRTRAGLPPFANKDVSPFTMRDPAISKAMTQHLISLGHEKLAQWNCSFLVYHLEIAASGGDRNSSFVWSSSQIRRIQRFQIARSVQSKMPACRTSEDVLVLVRITGIYTNPRFYFIIDPWELLIFNRLVLQDGFRFEASIDDPRETQFYPGQVSTSRYQQLWADAERVVTMPRKEPVTNNLVKYNRPYTYGYIGAKELRLLILFPGKKHDPLQGTIFTCPWTDLTEAGPYRTLSYEWGPDQQSKQYLSTHEGIVTLRESLYIALTHIRQEENPLILWIDAICFNQEEAAEKAQQILLLPKIFQNAARTLAFFGAGERFDEAIKTLLQIKAKDLYGTDYRKWPKSVPPIAALWEDSPTPHLDDMIWINIKHSFDHTWFRRVWIVQEAVVAPTVSIVCGKWIVDWNEIHAAMMVVQREVTPEEDISNSWEPFMTLSNMRGWEARGSRWNLMALLNTFSYVNSTLKCDRFFAFLGLASDGDRGAFRPDYRHETTFKEIACRFGEAFVDQGYGLQLLYRAGLGPQTEPLPSWLPDLTKPKINGLTDLREQGAKYKASADLHGDIRCLSPYLLTARGYLVDEIEQISRSNSGTVKARLKYFQQLESMVDEVAENYPPDRREGLKWKVPIAGAMYPKVAVSGEIDIVGSYQAFRQQLRKDGFKRKKDKN
ncbi:uncharacterized protein F4822DRAFT_443674 [Hypoxylon trugodes]|uniref:uncharacterized protein n=1 Tax=Hypoxylon trugodes TaxID=326681 RepID=UPI00219D6989|nr:uncharacterized protein F4822DRAFT_443674 [Hypoxylon trugodes]KAI1388885.1 hypothetical protein F4822DRAFT_443674 [Hypoxylon trugodes]